MENLTAAATLHYVGLIIAAWRAIGDVRAIAAAGANAGNEPRGARPEQLR